MPRRSDLKKILVLGSGGILIDMFLEDAVGADVDCLGTARTLWWREGGPVQRSNRAGLGFGPAS